MIEEKKHTVNERLQIWNELLTQEQGTTYENFLSVTQGKDTMETAKRDISTIKKLVELGGGEFETIGKRNTVFKVHNLTSTLVELHAQFMRTKPYSALLELLTHMKGVFPCQFYSDLYNSFDDIVSKREETDQIISFDTNPEIIDNMRYFSRLYSNIKSKRPFILTEHQVNCPEIQRSVTILPEYLKQYHSLWYIFGPAWDAEDMPLGIYKVRLDLIDSLKDSAKKISPSGTDYEEYFHQIIGVENYADREVMHVEFLISNRMYRRLCTNPLHVSQQPSRLASAKKGYKRMSIDVKKNIELVRNILNLGRDIIILSPAKLRNEIRKELQKSLENYE